MYLRHLFVATVGCAVFAGPLIAQKAPKAPSRPRAVTDSNSAEAYYRHALTVMEARPEEAAQALYWATQIEPSWARALYARRVAELRADEYRMVRYLRGDRRTRRDFAASDSLLYRARMIEPFLRQDQDRALITHYYTAWIAQDIRRTNPNAYEGEVRYAVERYVADLMRSGRDPASMGWIAESEGRLQEAATYYGKALERKNHDPWLHDDRATVFFALNSLDSAASELQVALDELKARDRKEDVVIYRPKSMFHYRLAHVQLRQNRIEDARRNLEAALEEDLAFWPAHMTFANLALATGDTTGAIGAMQLAVELNPSEVLPFMRHAELLLATGRAEEARGALTRVVEMAPLYATPHLELALIAETMEARDEAVGRYRDFLARAPRGDPRMTRVRQRLETLGAAGGAP